MAMRQRKLALPLAAMLLLAAAPAGAKPAYAEHGDRLELSTGLVTVDFQGKKPLLHVKDPGNASRSFTLALQRLVEVPRGSDLRGGVEVASFDLARAQDWTANVTRGDGGVHLTLHREGPLQVRPGPAPRVPGEARNLTHGTLPGAEANATAGNASVFLVFHVYERDRALPAGNGSVNVTRAEVKFDLRVERWDWVHPGDVLALELLLAGGGAMEPRDAQGREVALEAQGQRLGWFHWAATARAHVNASMQDVPVEHRAGGRGQAEGGGEGARHWLVYDAPGFGLLVHDPVVGIAPTHAAQGAGSSPVPGPGLGLAALAAAGAAAGAAGLRRLRRG